ncbi:MAG: hypothetical protein ACE5GM_09265 [bacterium]
MAKKSKSKKKRPSNPSLPKGKKFPSEAITKPAETAGSKSEEPLPSFVDDPLPRNFYWFLGLIGFLFVAFLFTEPFYRQ